MAEMIDYTKSPLTDEDIAVCLKCGRNGEMAKFHTGAYEYTHVIEVKEGRRAVTDYCAVSVDEQLEIATGERAALLTVLVKLNALSEIIYDYVGEDRTDEEWDRAFHALQAMVWVETTKAIEATTGKEDDESQK